MDQSSYTESSSEEVGVITPEESILASQSFGIVDFLWRGKANANVVLNNWGKEALNFLKDQQVGIVTPSFVVAQGDPEWEKFNARVWLCDTESTEATTTKREQFQKQLVYGEHLTLRDKQLVEKLLLAHTELFVLTDYELRETDLVTHSIDTGSNSKGFTTQVTLHSEVRVGSRDAEVDGFGLYRAEK